MVYRNRTEAGRFLAERLTHYAGREDAIVLALPRGGAPVGFEVAKALGLPFDVYLVRKLGVPGREELALGAIASGGVRVLNEGVVLSLGISESVIDRIAAEEERELARREREYRGDRPPVDASGQVVILVDDGLATGSSMRAAIAALRRRGPTRIVVAVPVGATDTCADIRREADEVVCAREPDTFFAVGNWYEDFSQTSDEEVRDLLERRADRRADRRAAPRQGAEFSRIK